MDRNASNAGPATPDLRDGRWHMISLSSQPDGSSGFRMYVDGTLAGEMAANATYDGAARWSILRTCLPLGSSLVALMCFRHCMGILSAWHQGCS